MKNSFSLLLVCLLGIFFNPAHAQFARIGLEPLDGGTILRMEAPVQEDGSHKFGLRIRTTEVYPCSNYEIINSVKLNTEKSKVVVTVKGTREPDPCAMTIGPATGFIDLSDVPYGNYEMKIWVNRMDFLSYLTVGEDFYEITLDESVDNDLMKVPNPTLRLVPEGHIWGSLYFEKEEIREAVAKFLEDLESEGAKAARITPGDYGYFYFFDTGETPEKGNGAGYEQPFVRAFGGDAERVQLLVDMYKKKYGNDLRFELYMSNGKRIK